MKGALYGRIVFGLSAVLFGVITLIWRDAAAWQNLPLIKLPSFIGACLAIAQIAGGTGILFGRSVRPASVLLGVVYAVFALADIPGIVKHPTVFGVYDGFFEWLSLVCGATAAYALAAPLPSAKLVGAARLGLGLSTISFTLAQAVYLHETAALVPTWILPNQMFWAVLTTVAFALAAIGILINVQARLAAQLMTLMIVIFGLLVWVPLVIAHPESHENWSEGTLNFLIAGAAWIVASALTASSSKPA
jgi:hypothetical protein